MIRYPAIQGYFMHVHVYTAYMADIASQVPLVQHNYSFSHISCQVSIHLLNVAYCHCRLMHHAQVVLVMLKGYIMCAQYFLRERSGYRLIIFAGRNDSKPIYDSRDNLIFIQQSLPCPVDNN